MNPQLEEIREKRNAKVSGILKYFNTIMGAFYVVLGVALFFYPIFGESSDWVSYLVSTLLIAYGIFRLWRALKT